MLAGCPPGNRDKGMAEEHDRSMMENLYWWGVPTLFRAPHQGPEGADIALAGVPHSTGNGTTERDQHLGPRAVRNVSALQRRVHGAFGMAKCTKYGIVKCFGSGDIVGAEHDVRVHVTFLCTVRRTHTLHHRTVE